MLHSLLVQAATQPHQVALWRSCPPMRMKDDLRGDDHRRCHRSVFLRQRKPTGRPIHHRHCYRRHRQHLAILGTLTHTTLTPFPLVLRSQQHCTQKAEKIVLDNDVKEAYNIIIRETQGISRRCPSKLSGRPPTTGVRRTFEFGPLGGGRHMDLVLSNLPSHQIFRTVPSRAHNRVWPRATQPAHNSEA